MFGCKNGVYVLTKHELIGEFRAIGSFSACVFSFGDSAVKPRSEQQQGFVFFYCSWNRTQETLFKGFISANTLCVVSQTQSGTIILLCGPHHSFNCHTVVWSAAELVLLRAQGIIQFQCLAVALTPHSAKESGLSPRWPAWSYLQNMHFLL